jgi:hypothetical protein
MADQFVRDPGPGPAGIVLVIATVAGVVLAVRGLRDGQRARLAATAGLLCGAVLLVPALAYSRGGRVDLEGHGSDPTPSRYLYLLVAFLLPTVFLAASEVARRWPRGRLLLAVAVVACLPRNLGLLRVEPSHTEFVAFTTVAELVGSYDVVLDNGEDRGFASTAWLSEHQRAGRIPPAPPEGDPLRATVRDAFFGTLILQGTEDDDLAGCAPAPVRPSHVDAGERLVFVGDADAVEVSDPDRGLRTGIPIDRGRTAVQVMAGPATLEVDAEAPVETWVCPATA